MKVLVGYATAHGSTEGIANRVGDRLHPVAPRDGALDDLTVVRGSRKDRDKKHRMSWGGSPERLSNLLRRLGKRNKFPHAVVAVESGDGSFRWSEATGTADTSDTPMQHDTPYFLASIDKLYNATIVLKLHERGQLRLDERITTYSRYDSSAGNALGWESARRDSTHDALVLGHVQHR